MYSSYTTLQRVQLAKQEYLDTQEVFLGVYAPGRNAALKASLQDQLHRKFLLTDSLRPEALGSAVGVLLVREDLFLMPTALSCFADALRSGADYVTSDAVFGYSASPPSTTVRALQPARLRPQQRHLPRVERWKHHPLLRRWGRSLSAEFLLQRGNQLLQLGTNQFRPHPAHRAGKD